ncbi:MAG: hypothetical protein CMC59_08295 [Flavobacteriaceae bacterium]|nr:hypothetical protein [Flavobacteriaceae bacterium]|tara:strand:- start:316 stop:519 length:204 start_codon:yes stop_codon:yes gene_type:complete
MAIYKDSKELKAATGADLMLRSAFKLELENIEARIKNGTFYHPTPETIIDYLKLRIKEISEMKNANL